MKTSMRPFVFIVMLVGLSLAEFAVALAANAVSAPRTITVALDGSGEFSSLQEAVDSLLHLMQRLVLAPRHHP